MGGGTENSKGKSIINNTTSGEVAQRLIDNPAHTVLRPSTSATFSSAYYWGGAGRGGDAWGWYSKQVKARRGLWLSRGFVAGVGWWRLFWERGGW